MEGIWVVLIVLIVFGSFFGGIAAIFIVPAWLKSRERIQVQQTVRAAIERGESLPPEMIESITKEIRQAPPVVRDLRIGVIWLAVAIGLAIFGYTAAWEDGDAFHPLLGMATIPGLVGLAYLAMAGINAATKRKDA